MSEIIANKTVQICFLHVVIVRSLNREYKINVKKTPLEVLPFCALHSHFTSWAKYSETGTSDFIIIIIRIFTQDCPSVHCTVINGVLYIELN